MINKLREIENKAIIGGENLLEKAELQEKLLAETEAELEKQRVKELELQDELCKKQAEILQIEESYGTLQEEVVGLNKKLKKVFTLMKSAQSELSDKRSDYAKLKEDMLETIRATQREIKLADFIIKHYIPGEFLLRNSYWENRQTICNNLISNFLILIFSQRTTWILFDRPPSTTNMSASGSWSASPTPALI